MAKRGFITYRPPSPLLAAVLIVMTMAWSPRVGADRGEGDVGGLEWCGRGRGVGDKWFDGCQWCVCTLQGPHCSSSTCSSLVKQVPACHSPGQRWKDGCYRCHCRRHGITCRLDNTCRLLRQQPVPCLADERCVCGPDGVPSCTAEVIDRNAYAAKRVHLGVSHRLGSPKGSFQDSYNRGRHSGLRGGWERASQRHRRYRRSLSSPHHLLAADTFQRAGYPHVPEGRTIVRRSDRYASRLLSQRHVTSSERGSRSAEQSATQELLITSDNLCRFGARWYGGSLRCFCDVDGAIACGNPVLVLAFFDDFRVEGKPCEEGNAWEDRCRVCTCQMNGVVFCRGSQNCGQRGLFPGNDDNDDDDYLPDLSEDSEEEEDSVIFPSTSQPWRNTEPAVQCQPGAQWRKGCLHCRCTRHGRELCSRRYCDEVDTHLSGLGAEGRRDLNPPPSRNRAMAPVTLDTPLKRFRGPMMVAPKPAGLFHPPAYAKLPSQPLPLKQCGRFSVGMKYWDDCNLCLCTSRGPRCQGKLCR